MSAGGGRGALSPWLPVLILLASCGGDEGTGPQVDPDQVAEVRITAPFNQVALDHELLLRAFAYNGEGIVLAAAFTWDASDPDVVGLDRGIVTGLQLGSVVVTATTGGVSGSFAVEVVNVLRPVAPEGAAAAVTGSDVTLTWVDRAAYEDGFIIQRAAWSPGATYGDDDLHEVGRVGPDVTSFVDVAPDPNGHWIYRVGAFNLNGDAFGSLTGEVRTGTLSVDPVLLPAAFRGLGWTGAVTASGGSGPHDWSVVAGELPGGITLAADGTLSGTPVEVGADTVTLRATSGPEFQEVGVALPVSLPLADVALGSEHACALDLEGAVHCWGSNLEGQFGVLPAAPLPDLPVPQGGSARYSSVHAGGDVSCALTSDGAATCWGSGNLGDGRGDVVASAPVAVSGGHAFQTLSGGETAWCGVTLTGTGYCWGDNLHGQLEDSLLAGSAVPVPVAAGHELRTIGVGQEHVCALTTEGATLCWGDNFFGQLGNPTRERFDTAVVVTEAPVFSELRIGPYYSCGLEPGGRTSCWGYNSRGQLGSGDPVSTVHFGPRPVAGEPPFDLLAAGGIFACGSAGGELSCWGERLHDGFPVVQDVEPRFLSNQFDFVRLVAGADRVCGLEADGKYYCWGRWGLGDGLQTDRGEPVRESSRIVPPDPGG